MNVLRHVPRFRLRGLALKFAPKEADRGRLGILAESGQ
jgi:hypothetical protein